MIDYGYVNYNNLESEHPELVPTVFSNDDARIDLELELEKFFHLLPQEQLEIILCRYFDLKPIEIMKILEYPGIGRVYEGNKKVHNSYKKLKLQFLVYN